MAEGTSRRLPESEAVEGDKELAVPEIPEDSEQPMVRPKECKTRKEGCPTESQEASETGIVQSSSGRDCEAQGANTPSCWSTIPRVEGEEMD